MTKQELIELTNAVIDLSRSIGDWMKDQTVSESTAEIKTENNLVTFVDKESERRFVEGLKKIVPQAGFVAEEGTGERNVDGLNWVIDPLDGTTNFVHGVPVWCTSIALADKNKAIVGVIYDPHRNEMFSASIGSGAFLNGSPIRVSNIDSINASLLATGFPYDDFGREEQYLRLFQELMHNTRGMRRLGSAALDMAWTACGRFEGFYEYGLNPWDVAAGAIIVEEAGGLVTEFNDGNNPIFGEDVNCTNGHIHQQLKQIISKYFK
ncbi:MAG: inositol monophosphatase family protein [Flavobacteriales bacterium]|jgi:myo-inositol-1(or 4)-monophosphatase